MAYTPLNFVPGEILTAAKMNLLAANDASFRDGTGFSDDSIQLSKLKGGNLSWNILNIISPFIPTTDVYEAPRYTKTIDNRVILEGLIRHPNAGTGVVAVLPANYRPSKTVIFLAAADNGFAHFYIQPNGNIALTTQIHNWVSLSGIVFSQ